MPKLNISLLLTIVLLAATADAAEPKATSCTETAGPTRALGLYKPGEPISLAEGFADPPAISRVQCWWQCHGSAFTKGEITRQLEEFKAKGMGGVTVKDTTVQPRDEKTRHIKNIPYMSPQWLDMFAHVVAECGRLGLICRTRLGSGWNAGGPWVTPEMSTQALAFARSEPITGPKKFSGPIPVAEHGAPTSKALADSEAFVLAVNKSSHKGIDLTDKVGADRKLTWDVPEGTWTILSCFSKSHDRMVGSCSPSGAGRHHDHISNAGTDLELANVAEPILAKLGTFKGTAFDGLNCDSWELGNPTWTPGFRQTFIARRGYDPVPWLPVLSAIDDKGIGRKVKVDDLTAEESRFLFDFRSTVGELVVETHYHRVAEWCRAHGVAFEAEAGGPSVVPRDMLQAQGVVDIPMGEFWMGGWTCVKTASSAAHIYGRRLVGLESYTDTRKTKHFAITPAQMKTRVDEAYLLGGNYLNMAVTEYSPAEAGLPGWVHAAGPHLNHCQTWWPLARPFYDYMARCCFLLQSGRDVAQVAEYRTFREDKTQLWREVNDKLSSWPKEFAFDYVCDDIVQNRMRVSDGRLVLGSEASYQMLYVVPSKQPSMPLATLTKIRDLLNRGATVAWAGPRPDTCPGLTGYPKCDAQFKAVADELWANQRLVKLEKDDRSQLVPLVAKSKGPPCWKTINNAPLRFVHRRTAGADIFFVVNRATWAVDTPVTFRVEGRRPECWNPDTGAIEPAVSKKVDGGTRLAIKLPPLSSVFVVFRADAAKSQPAQIAKPAKLPAPLAIDGPWEVEFPEGSGAPAKATFPALKSWTEMEQPGIRDFSGIATYRCTFDCPAASQAARHARLDLGRVAEVCEVRLNGKPLGGGWHPPYAFDVGDNLRPGKNTLEIRVANLWHNRLVADAALAKAQRVTRMVPEAHYRNVAGQKPLDSGLLGPVRISF